MRFNTSVFVFVYIVSHSCLYTESEWICFACSMGVSKLHFTPIQLQMCAPKIYRVLLFRFKCVITIILCGCFFFSLLRLSLFFLHTRFTFFPIRSFLSLFLSSVVLGVCIDRIRFDIIFGYKAARYSSYVSFLKNLYRMWHEYYWKMSTDVQKKTFFFWLLLWLLMLLLLFLFLKYRYGYYCSRCRFSMYFAVCRRRRRCVFFPPLVV